MTDFKIIPVIDILNSRAVHAVKGERNQYEPLRSVLFHSVNPVEIIRSLNENFGFKDFYIADLDAIINRQPNLELISEILTTSEIRIMLDPGIVNKEDTEIYSKLNLKYLIFGLETIESLQIITDCFNMIEKKTSL